MLYVPPEIREAWPAPNYTDPLTRGPGLTIVVLTFHILATVMVALRSYTRLQLTFSFGLDDIFTIVALVSKTLGIDIKSFIATLLLTGI